MASVMEAARDNGVRVTPSQCQNRGSVGLGRLASVVGLCALVTGCARAPVVDLSAVSITVSAMPDDTDDSGPATVQVVGLPVAQVDTLRNDGLTAQQWSELLRVTVVMEDGTADSDLPAVLGSHTVDENGSLRFTPMFPFDAGRSYAVRLDPSRLPGLDGTAGDTLTAVKTLVSLPKSDVQRTTVVDRIFPSGDRVPENQLKLYLHFSAPMSHVDGLAYLTLQDERGRDVDAPFLPFGTEFWNADHTRYTVFFDPGRIKQGLELNAQLGRSLRAGETYALVVDPAWPDAQGNPLQAPFEKRFSVGPADAVPLDHTTWRLRVPAAGSTQRLVVSFPEPLDHALMQRAIGVETAAGEPVHGEVESGSWETRWLLTPARPWVAGTYALVASTIVEDLAGNQIGIPFEVTERGAVPDARSSSREAGARASGGPHGETVSIPFEIR
jgi:hypothetical protein